jgi:hypothetical protein
MDSINPFKTPYFQYALCGSLAHNDRYPPLIIPPIFNSNNENTNQECAEKEEVEHEE